MLSTFHNQTVWKWIVIVGALLLGLPAIVYAASYVLNSGEFVGLGVSDGASSSLKKGPWTISSLPMAVWALTSRLRDSAFIWAMATS